MEVEERHRALVQRLTAQYRGALLLAPTTALSAVAGTQWAFPPPRAQRTTPFVVSPEATSTASRVLTLARRVAGASAARSVRPIAAVGAGYRLFRAIQSVGVRASTLLNMFPATKDMRKWTVAQIVAFAQQKCAEGHTEVYTPVIDHVEQRRLRTDDVLTIAELVVDLTDALGQSVPSLLQRAQVKRGVARMLAKPLAGVLQLPDGPATTWSHGELADALVDTVASLLDGNAVEALRTGLVALPPMIKWSVYSYAQGAIDEVANAAKQGLDNVTSAARGARQQADHLTTAVTSLAWEAQQQAIDVVNGWLNKYKGQFDTGPLDAARAHAVLDVLFDADGSPG